MKICWTLLFPLFLLVTACAPPRTPPSTPSPEPIKLIPRAEVIPSNAVKALPEDDPFPPILHSSEWHQPVPLQPPVNTAGAEDSPFINPDGDRLFFWFTPDPTVPVERQLVDGVTGIYMTFNVDGAWQEPVLVVTWAPDEVAMDGCPFFLDDVLWFCSVRVANLGEIDLWTIRYQEGEWVDLENAGEKLNVEYKIGEMHLSADGEELYFHGLPPNGEEGIDLYVTRWIDGEWAEPIPLSALNTEANEGWPFLSEDGNELWFIRNHQGYPAIFRSKRISGDWCEPELIVSQFAAEPSLDREGNLYFIHHFVQDGVMLDADVYVAYHK